MAKVNFVLQGKGGVGKTVAAAMLAQYKLAQGREVICIDTDPVNATFVGYKALDVQRLNIMEGDEINSRNFDSLVDTITNTTPEQDVIIDNGASSFVPLSAYLITNEVPALLAGMGHEIIVHTVVTGGQAFVDTVSGFQQVINQYPEECSFVVWLNPYWGAVENNGIPFEKMKAYTDKKSRVSGLVHIPQLKEDTFGKDFADMLKARQTFDEVLADSNLSIMVRHRLKQTRDKIFGQLNLIDVI